jgi:hypothetical protein
MLIAQVGRAVLCPRRCAEDGAPYPNRQGAWLDREERLLGFGLQTPTKVFRFKEQIPFETLTESTSGSLE